VRRTLMTAGASLMFLVLVGATYQGVATALERRQFPHPGRLIDIGGHQLHMYCVGEGSPTVVLEAPAAGMSAAWGWVQPALADLTRVCSYDRAGLGWSEAGDTSFEPSTVAGQLHALVEQSGERAPLVLAGQGLGAALVTLYASEFPNDVNALVLIDAPSPAGADSSARDVTRLVAMSPWLARAGVLRTTHLLSASAEGLPEPSAGAMRAFLNRPDHLTRAARELARWDDAVALAGAAPMNNRIHVTRVTTRDGERVAFLSNREEARAVAARIGEAVDFSRRGR
jgi:pimeloyl-ACP methyl ester carboxylesterase